MNIAIGGVSFNFNSDGVFLNTVGPNHWQQVGFSLAGDNYQPFLDVDVKISNKPPPDKHDFELIFEGDFFWKCYRKTREYLIIQEDPESRTPLVTSLFHEDGKSISVFCTDKYQELLRRKDLEHPFTYPLDQLAVSFVLGDHDGGIFHSAGWEHNGNLWVFPGKSGYGKSTISKMIKDITGDTMLSDDRMVLRHTGESQVMGYGTPWAGDQNDAINGCAPLCGLLFLKQGEENSIDKIDPLSVLKRLFPVMTIAWYDETKVNRMMDFINKLLQVVPCYEFTFTREESAVHTLLEFVADVKQ